MRNSADCFGTPERTAKAQVGNGASGDATRQRSSELSPIAVHKKLQKLEHRLDQYLIAQNWRSSRMVKRTAPDEDALHERLGGSRTIRRASATL